MNAIVLLAAGGSKRLGQPKQLVLFEQKTLLRRAAEAALAVSKNVAVVLGAHFEKVAPELSGLAVEILKNENWAEGMAASVRLGAAWATEKKGLEAVVFSVIDQPALAPEIFENLFFQLEKSQKGIAASLFDDQTIGPPVAFRPRFLPQLLLLKGDAGAKKIVLKHENQTVRVPFFGGAWDVDEAKDLPASA